jgi:hypothetical protein
MNCRSSPEPKEFSMRTPLVTTILAATLLMSATACTESSNAQGEPEIGEIPVITDIAQVELPLDSYALAIQDYQSVQRASWYLIADCVTRFGGTYTLTEETFLSMHQALFENAHERRYGLFDADSAAIHGYRVPGALIEPDATEKETTGWNPSDTELLIVRGTSAGIGGAPPTDTSGDPLPEDGCSGEATRIIEDGLPEPEDIMLIGELARESFARSEADSRVRDALSRWSDCMAEHGYDYQTIWDPNDFEWPDPVGDEEINAASADVECKRSANLIGVWSTVEAAYQERLVSENEEGLNDLRDYNRGQIDNAASVLTGN